MQVYPDSGVKPSTALFLLIRHCFRDTQSLTIEAHLEISDVVIIHYTASRLPVLIDLRRILSLSGGIKLHFIVYVGDYFIRRE